MQRDITISVDEKTYKSLMEKVGEENLDEFFVKLAQPYLIMNERAKHGSSHGSLLGLTRGSVEITGDVLSPVTDEQDWKVMS